MNNIDMDIISRLASSLGRRDEEPNIELAKEIVDNNDLDAVSILVKNLDNKKDIQNDCIKVIYEIGELNGKLIANHKDTFLNSLNTKNNRLQWGLMSALKCITSIESEYLYKNISTILDVAGSGSVITKDKAFEILVQLCEQEKYFENSLVLIFEQLKISLPNQLPMYAEKTIFLIDENHSKKFNEILESRLIDIEKESKKKRIIKVIDKINKKFS